MSELSSLHALADAMGVQTRYVDGLGQSVDVGPDTLVRVCAALGAPVDGPGDAAGALDEIVAARAETVPRIVVAWDGVVPPIRVATTATAATLTLEGGSTGDIPIADGQLQISWPLPAGYHQLAVDVGSGAADCTILSAPTHAFRPAHPARSWGVGTHLAALRSAGSRSVGDLRDLEMVCAWIRGCGGDVVTVLPLLPTFNTGDPEPSPYSPVSRLFWSELVIHLGGRHAPTGDVAAIDVRRAHDEVRAALGDTHPDPSRVDPELARYARFRGAQERLGRNWRAWPARARGGALHDDEIDPDVERFHLAAQLIARDQLHGLRERLDGAGMRLGLDLAVGVHPDGYDVWSRQQLFAGAMSVGAPPDPGFPSGQDWGFAPVLPGASRAEGHRYAAASIAHQMGLAALLRVDHIMAWSRLYWIPHGMRLDEGTYVKNPADELFAVLTIESQRHTCEVIGENLGTVPEEIRMALPRHRIHGMYVAQFAAADEEAIAAPAPDDVALIGTHDTPTLAGWIGGEDVGDRLVHGLLAPDLEDSVLADRSSAARRLAEALGVAPGDQAALLDAMLQWLGRSASPLVIPWLEDLWLEERGVNLPGTRSSVQPNWQRPMGRLLEAVFHDPVVLDRLALLDASRRV